MKKSHRCRAGLLTRLYFLFTGSIPGYWYIAEKDVMRAYMNYYLAKLFKAETDEERVEISKKLDVFCTHRFSKQMIEDYIVPNSEDFTPEREVCGTGVRLRYFNFFAKEWLK